jgi:hypothetical protein
MVRRTWCVLAAAWALAGCAPGNPGLVVGGVIGPNETCILDVGNPRLTRGALDVAAFEVSYSMTPVLFNQLINLSTQGAPPRADPNVVNVVRAEVELRDVNGAPFLLGALPNPFTVPATGFIPSSDGTSAGVGLGDVEVVPPAYGEELRAIGTGTIVAAVRVLGVTAGGADVESSEFIWPIDICTGCLFACVRDEEGRAQCTPSCRPGQDTVTVTPAACDSPDLVTSCVPGA